MGIATGRIVMPRRKLEERSREDEIERGFGQFRWSVLMRWVLMRKKDRVAGVICLEGRFAAVVRSDH